ncbi:MAG: hypothetical protein ACRD2A_21975 [Vicinamibacterales bacterium]
MALVFRHGDVFLIQVRVVPTGLVRVPRDASGRIILARGETTGHAHAIQDQDAEMLWDPELEERFLEVLRDSGVKLSHEEHDPLVVPRGVYRVFRQREYEPNEERQSRRVAD